MFLLLEFCHQTREQTPSSPHLLLSQLSGPLVEVDVGLPQDNMCVTSANTLRWDRRDISVIIQPTHEICLMSQKEKTIHHTLIRNKLHKSYVLKLLIIHLTLIMQRMKLWCFQYSSGKTLPWWQWWRRQSSSYHRCSCWEHEECAGTSQGWPKTMNIEHTCYHRCTKLSEPKRIMWYTRNTINSNNLWTSNRTVNASHIQTLLTRFKYFRSKLWIQKCRLCICT